MDAMRDDIRTSMSRTTEIVNGQPVAAHWLPGEAVLIAEMSRLDWCRDHARVLEIGRALVELRGGSRG